MKKTSITQLRDANHILEERLAISGRTGSRKRRKHEKTPVSSFVGAKKESIQSASRKRKKRNSPTLNLWEIISIN